LAGLGVRLPDRGARGTPCHFPVAARLDKLYFYKYTLIVNKRLKGVLAENLRAYRLKGGLSQTDLAKKAGTPQPRVAVMESTTNPTLPTLEWLERVGNALAVDVADLLRGRTASETKSLSSLPENEDNLAAHLKELGAPLTGTSDKTRVFSPEAVVLGALRAPSARMVESVPGVLCRNALSHEKLLRLATERGLVNRLGFMVDVALRLARERHGERASELSRLSKRLWLKRRRDAEDFLMQEMTDDAEFRTWLKRKTPAAGKRWRVFGAYSMERFRDAAR
jgi:transcriptional regulator with XRE-family HTH domain